MSSEVLDELDAEPEKLITYLELSRDSSAKKVDEVCTKLREKHRAELLHLLKKYTHNGQRLSCWLINRELTNRNIPPIFRDLPDPNHDDKTQLADLVWIDLEWLWAKHKGHKPFFSRWKQIFNGAVFPHPTASFIFSQMSALMWKTTKGLALPEDWQKELHYIKLDKLRSDYDQIVSMKPEVLDRLRKGIFADRFRQAHL